MRAFKAFTLLVVALGVPVRGQEKTSPEPEESYGSPKAVFDAMGKATKKKDFKTVLKCLAPESRDLVMANLVATGWFLRISANLVDDPKKKEVLAQFDKTLAKHGVTKEALARWEAAKNPDEDLKAAKALAALVKDKAAFMGEVTTLLEKLETDKVEHPGNELKDVKITGTKACGQIVVKDIGGEYRELIDFVKVGGGWLVVMPEVKALAGRDLPPPPPPLKK